MSNTPILPPLVITMGEPAGIAPEIIAASWRHFRARHSDSNPYHFIVIGDADLLAARGHIPTQALASVRQEHDFTQAMPVLHRPLKATTIPGKPNPQNAAVVQAAIREAAMLCQHGWASAMITAPIDKSVLQSVDFPFMGHTDYLEWLDQQYSGQPRTSVMLLADDTLRCVPVTVHISLKQAIADLTSARIGDVIQVFVQSLHQQFGIPCPRLAVSGLNPHAGEKGLMGDEESTIITPTLNRLNQTSQGKYHLDGPLPADSMFTRPMRQKYDGFVCMYHDQALIPIKTLAFDQAVNITLGLGFLRTAPDHGTAYILAGSNQADPSSMIQAIIQARHMIENTRKETHADSNARPD